ncbi:MAG: helix-turn-helix transcriptional regulator [Pseudolabrys sp.]
MSQSQALSKTIESIYDAGTDHARWPTALGLIGELVDGRFCDLIVMHRNRIVTETASRPDANSFLKDVDRELWKENLWFQRQHLDPGNRTIVGEQLASPAELKKTRFYSEFLKVVDLFHMCGAKFSSSSDLTYFIGAVRSERQPPFGHREVELMDSVLPHISRATRIAALLQDLNLYAAGLESAASQLAFGMLLIDETDRVLYANVEAERQLREERIIYQRNGRLAAATGSLQQKLSTFLSGLAFFSEADALHLADTRGQGMKLVGAPLPQRRRDFACLGPTARSVIFLFDDATNTPPPMRLIAKLYGLTPAESRLAEALMASETLAEYEERADLTHNTIKTQLRSLFAKTGTRRQSDLMRQLAKLVAVA